MDILDLKRIFWFKIVPGILSKIFIGSIFVSLAFDLVGDTKRQFIWVLGAGIILFSLWQTKNAIQGYFLLKKYSEEN